MTSYTRRAVLAALAATAATPALAKIKKKQKLPAGEGPLEELGERLLARLRETATYNGTAGALNGGLLARSMDDFSPAGEQALRAEYQAGLNTLAAIRVRGDSPLAQHMATASAVLNNGTRSAAISYGRINPFNFTGHNPYIVSQISGPHIDTPNIMMEQQALNTPKAVDAWIEKLDGFGIGFAHVLEKVRADAAAGCIPPKALLAKTLPVLDEFISTKPESHPMITAFRRKTNEAGLARRIRSNAEKAAITALDTRAKPAFQALRDEIAKMLPTGRDESGVWAQPQGDAFYAASVKTLGDSDLSTNEIHDTGIDEIGRIAGQMNALLAKQGLTKGSISERMQIIAKDPKNLFADSDAGREELLSYLRLKVRDAEKLYGAFLPDSMVPHQSLVVKRVPVATQDGAPGGYYDGPSLDGTRPGTYWINLRDMNAVPRFHLPTLSYHEGVPGHHTQGAISAALGEAPTLIRIASFNAYQEGWALYAERLMAELGAYKEDPLGDLGRLQDELFRAARLVIDTGLHSKRWTREQAIRSMRDITGAAETRVTAEVERYMAWPGQALGYKLGQLRLLQLREAYLASKDKGNDLRQFNSIVLGGGAMPLALVASRVATK